MAIKRKTFGKKYWIPAVITGVVLLVAAVIIFGEICLRQTEAGLVKTANYMKVQCATYTHYNNGSETQALLRAIESNQQVRDHIRENNKAGGVLSSELLKQYAGQLWLHGILVLDAEGNIVCRYAEDIQVEQEFLNHYNKGTVLGGEGYTNRNYAQRIYLDDGGYINMAATARKDAGGMVVTYYYITPECAQVYSLTIQSLLEGYELSSEGTIMITDEGNVVACNDSELIGTKTVDNAIVQTLKAKGSSRHIVHIRGSRCYGIMLKQRDYYIYAYVPDKIVFSALPQNVVMILILYILVAGIVGMLLRVSDREHLKLESEKEAEYKQSLLEAARKAEAANIAKTRFLQRMSHDIRTPINGICGMLEVADYYADDLGKQAECRDKIRDASHLLLELINEVLDMGKLEAGEVELENQPFNLHTILEEVIVVIERLAAEQGIRLIQDHYEVSHWNLIGSQRHVKRLLMNIMSNAVKYNKPNGTITIRCRELPEPEEGSVRMEFVCEDTGIGMSEEYQKKIFEPFTQENNSIQTKYGGSGLGMPIAKGLVDRMDGTLTFESEEGKGSIFVVTIPFRINPEEPEQSEGKKKTDYSIRGLHILLVEDNELNMEISEFVLKTEGAEVTKAWNGKEAVEIFAASRPGEFDAILMDVMMPVMDGYQATGMIRAMEREDARTITIIAMTANAFSEDRIHARKAGMDAHVSKPLDVSLLIETLDRLVKRK